MSEISIKRALTPWFHIQAIFNMSKYGKRHTECLKILHGFTKKVIAERKAAMRGQVSASATVSSDEDNSIGKFEATKLEIHEDKVLMQEASGNILYK